MASMAISLALPAFTDNTVTVGGGGVPAGALLDEAGVAILDENGDYILME